MKRSLLGLGVLIVFFSTACKTTPTLPPSRTLEEITLSEIEQLIFKEQPTLALQWILALRNTSSVPRIEYQQLERLETEAKTKLIEQFHQSIESSDYLRALSLYRSFRTVYGARDLENYSKDRILFLLAEEEKNKGNLVLALSYFRSIKDYQSIGDEALLAYARIALDLNNLIASKNILSVLTNRGSSLPPDIVELSHRKIPLAEYLGGTMTIWVNRGIRIDRGIGIPDRVIGSGFYIDPRGYLLTNYHVIQSEVDPEYEGYSRLFIRPSGRTDERIPAKVVGYDKIFDIALLKVETKPPFLFGMTDIQELKVGSRIYALGSPGGLENTITSGIISAVGRRFFQLGDAMQMDVPVNPGSSGGPLIDEDGRLVGIVFAGIEQFQGVNFAIPAFWIQKILPQLYKPGEVAHTWLGVSVRETKEGLEILYVARGSPAHMVGIQRGDRIIYIEDIPIQKVQEAQSLLLSLPEGTLVKVGISRGEEKKTFVLALAKRPYSPLENVIDFEAKEELFAPLFGFTARSLASGLFSSDFIVEQVYPGSVADETGISQHDPFTLRNWIVDKKRRIVLMQISIKQRRSGFLEGNIQIGAFLEQPNFL
ncbi:MAG: trypsin-like peptidase domain-containing protein [Spirochaetales bacterium]